MEPVRITYALSEEQFLRASAELWNHRAIGEKGNWILVSAVGLFGLFLIWQDAILGWGPLMLALLVGGLTLSRRFFWRSAYQLAEKYKEAISVVFTDDEIETTTWIKTGSVPYSTFKTFLETDNFILLLIDSKRFSILPKSAVEEGDLERLQGHLAHHLEPERKRWL
jgi:hypothetical protein